MLILKLMQLEITTLRHHLPVNVVKHSNIILTLSKLCEIATIILLYQYAIETQMVSPHVQIARHFGSFNELIAD